MAVLITTKTNTWYLKWKPLATLSTIYLRSRLLVRISKADSSLHTNSLGLKNDQGLVFVEPFTLNFGV